MIARDYVAATNTYLKARGPGLEAGLEANRVRNREEGVILRLSDRQTGDRFVRIEDLVTQHIHTDPNGYSGIPGSASTVGV